MADSEPLYDLDAGVFVPSPHTRGPWDPAYQHGGAPATLVARALEDVAGEGFAVTRMTVELLRPVPLEPLTVTVSITKPGGRTLGAGVRIEADGVPVVEARGIAIRLAELPAGGLDDSLDETLTPGPEAGRTSTFGNGGEGPAFHRTGMEIRAVRGGFDQSGPAQAWFRLQRAVVRDEKPTGLQRVAAAADFSNGLSWVLPYAQWIYLNPDLSLHLARPPEGEWVGLDASTLVSDRGTALAESIVYDGVGRLGRATQSLLVERRATS